MIICHNCKGNGYVKIKFEAEKSTIQCEVCDSQGVSMKVSTTTKPGVMGFRMKSHHSTLDHHLIQKGLKTTKFIKSKPVIQFKGEPPFRVGIEEFFNGSMQIMAKAWRWFGPRFP